jgi:hypothetical protein
VVPNPRISACSTVVMTGSFSSDGQGIKMVGGIKNEALVGFQGLGFESVVQ